MNDTFTSLSAAYFEVKCYEFRNLHTVTAITFGQVSAGGHSLDLCQGTQALDFFKVFGVRPSHALVQGSLAHTSGEYPRVHLIVSRVHNLTPHTPPKA